MELISAILIGIGLSMDAFSLSLCYGILNLTKNKMKLLSSIVGLFHFFMPLFGMVLGNVVEHFLVIDMRYVVFIIFMLIGYEIFMSGAKKETNVILLNNIGLFVFGFTVSIDSFSAGIGLNFITNNYLLCSVVFSLTSTSFTYVGLILGKLIGIKYKDISKLIGGSILMVFALSYLFR